MTDAPDALQSALDTDDALLAAQWAHVQAWLSARFGKESVGIEAMLFLVGLQQRGLGYSPKLEKEVKQDVIMDGTYAAFETIGLYVREAETGEWLRAADLPDLPLDAQEKLLRVALVRYFAEYVEDLPEVS